MQHHWMQRIPCSLVKCIPIECSGFRACWLNAVNSMQPGKMHPDGMHWIPCSMIECSGFHAAWKNETLLNAVNFMQHDWMQWIPCSMIECSGFYAAWPKASRLNAVDSMQRHWMQRIPCIVVQWIPTVCTGVHEARPNASRLNAVDFFAAWPKASRLNAGDSMQHDWMQCTPFSVVNCIPIECSGLHAAWLNAEDSMHCGVMDPDCMQRIPCSVMTEWIPCSL